MKKVNKHMIKWFLSLLTLATLLLTLVSGNSSGVAARSGANQPQGAASFQGAETFYGGYKTVAGVETFLDSYTASHPGLAEKVDFGDSWCKVHAPCTQPTTGFSGFDMQALHITNRAVPGPKPVFWFDAGIHGHEIVPPELAMRFISWLLDNYDSDADAHWLVDYHDIWVVPLANPDAHYIASLGGDSPYLQRKNANNSDCQAYPPSGEAMFGVDLNRNFPFLWACCEGASDEPCSQLYRGPAPASEPETQAIIAQIKKLIPDQRGPSNFDKAPLTATGIVQSMHSIAKMNLYPWNFTTSPAPNHDDLHNIAAHMSAGDSGGNGYKVCPGESGCLSGADGNTGDWVYGELGAAVLTTEIGDDSFTPPYEQVEQLWNKNSGAMIYMAKLARTPYLLTRGPDSKAVSIEPSVVNAGSRPRISATINYRWLSNNYFQNVAAAEYYVDTPPWAGGKPVALGATDGSFNSATEIVGGNLDTSGLSVGRHIIFVRGRGENSYEGNESWGPLTAQFIDVVQSGGTPAPSANPNPTVTTGPSATPTSGSGSRTPLAPPVALPGSGSQLFPQTGKAASGVFFDYWNKNGGLAQQGYPISEVLGEVSALNGQAYTMQYFERAVFEYHPENAGTAYEVLLSQLGTFRYRQKYPNGAPDQIASSADGAVLFDQTGKRLGGLFLDYWNKNGGLAQQGYPISDEFEEKSDLDGKTYRVQYFERAVFEYHPENAGTAYEVLLSQLGTFRYREQYGR